MPHTKEGSNITRYRSYGNGGFADTENNTPHPVGNILANAKERNFSGNKIHSNNPHHNAKNHLNDVVFAKANVGIKASENVGLGLDLAVIDKVVRKYEDLIKEIAPDGHKSVENLLVTNKGKAAADRNGHMTDYDPPGYVTIVALETGVVESDAAVDISTSRLNAHKALGIDASESLKNIIAEVPSKNTTADIGAKAIAKDGEKASEGIDAAKGGVITASLHEGKIDAMHIAAVSLDKESKVLHHEARGIEPEAFHIEKNLIIAKESKVSSMAVDIVIALAANVGKESVDKDVAVDGTISCTIVEDGIIKEHVTK